MKEHSITITISLSTIPIGCRHTICLSVGTVVEVEALGAASFGDQLVVIAGHDVQLRL